MAKLAVATRAEIADTLRRAANGTIPEEELWRRFRNWSATFDDPRIIIASYQAEHYGGNFHARNIFFIRVNPDEEQLIQGREALNLLAQAFEEDWAEERIEGRPGSLFQHLHFTLGWFASISLAGVPWSIN
jgi:hypothetical protein